MEKFTISNGMAIRYAVFGKGTTTILLIHGYLESIEVWEKFAGELGKTHRIVMLDLPGSGMSDWAEKKIIPIDLMADVTADILERAKIDSPCTIVGHSMGGYVALALAQRHPDKVAKLVLLHSSPNPDTEEKRENRKREINLILEGKKEMLANINPARGFAKCNEKRCAEEIEELHDQAMFTEDDAIVATLRGMMEREDRNEFFAKLEKPKLMIFGTDDNYIPSEAAQAMIAKFPDAQYCWIENAGHMSFVEQTQITVETLVKFMD